MKAAARTVPGRLLVVLPQPLGDAVLATPALAALRAHLPRTHIVWAGRRAAQQALAGLPLRDAVVPLDGPPRRGVGGVRSAARQLRSARADAILLLPNSLSSALAARLARIPRRVGTGLSAARRLLLTETVDVPLVGGRLVPRPMQDLYLDLVRPFGVVAGEPTAPRVVVEPFDRERAARRLAATGLAGPWLGIQPGAAFGASKRIPPARLADTVRAARARHGWMPVVFAGPGEEQLAREVAAAIGPPCVAWDTDVPDVGELKALLAALTVLLTADAGPRHLAEALGVPTVAFLGPTDPRWSGRSGATVVRREDLTCLGCHARTCPLGHHACLSSLDPAQILEALERTQARAAARDGEAGQHA